MQADEEQLLLDAIDMAGFGNWTAVSQHVGSKSKEECKVVPLLSGISNPEVEVELLLPLLVAMDQTGHEETEIGYQNRGTMRIPS